MADERNMQVRAKSSPLRPLRLTFLDGMRGIAALYVSLHHAYLTLGYHGDGIGLGRVTALTTSWLAFGNVSVAIFIVLSGFCLMLPLARRGITEFPGGLNNFAVRRAWRILPPYYGAMALSLGLIALFPIFSKTTGGAWDDSLPVFAPGNLVSHLLLVHNLSRAWIYKIDYPMWSVSTEWEIYFIFALLLLPLLRRFGVLVTLVAAFALGFLIDRYLIWGHFHYIGLFALGMAAAWLLFARSPIAMWFRDKLPWGILTLALGAIFVLVNIGGISWHATHTTQSDIFCGLLSTCLILYLSRVSMGGDESSVGLKLKRLLESRMFVGLGTISYSLYLVHAIVIVVVTHFIKLLPLNPESMLWTQLVVSFPCVLLAAYVFYRIFEKPAILYRSRM